MSADAANGLVQLLHDNDVGRTFWAFFDDPAAAAAASARLPVVTRPLPGKGIGMVATRAIASQRAA